jgi:hypothetical protein
MIKISSKILTESQNLCRCTLSIELQLFLEVKGEVSLDALLVVTIIAIISKLSGISSSLLAVS